MSTSWTDIGTAIIGIIQAQSTKARNASIYNYAKNVPSGYPSITVTSRDGTGRFIDTQRNERHYIYSIHCYQERTEKKPNGEDPESYAERTLRALVDELITIFDSTANTQLGIPATVIYAYPIPSKWGYVKAPDVDVRSAEILIDVVTAKYDGS